MMLRRTSDPSWDVEVLSSAETNWKRARAVGTEPSRAAAIEKLTRPPRRLQVVVSVHNCRSERVLPKSVVRVWRAVGDDRYRQAWCAIDRRKP
jgi:hypothetical protein